MGWFDNLFGGGQKAAAKEQQKSIIRAEGLMREGANYLRPYEEQARPALGRYTNALEAYANPQKLYEDTVGGYNQSAGFQNRLNRNMDIINNQMARMGRTGLPSHQRSLADYITGAQQEDEQAYLQNIFGLRGTYLQGQEGLSRFGMDAAAGMGGNYNALAQNAMQMGQAKGQEHQANAGAWNNALAFAMNTGANAYSGGMAGVIKPYTSDYNRPPAPNYNISWGR